MSTFALSNVAIAAFRGLLLVTVICITVASNFAQTSLTSDGQVNNPRNNEPVGKRITLTNGRTLIVDEAWRRGTEVWYTSGGFTQSLPGGVKSIEPLSASEPAAKAGPAPTLSLANKQIGPGTPAVWIYLVGGASFKVDEVNRTSAGVWYRRGTISEFVAPERVARIETIAGESLKVERKRPDWTSGSDRIDELIRINGTRYGVDPYLVFCVIEHESHFRVRAVSPKGARGLMQLMPATARRFGVSRPFDPADNIDGGTQYLKKLMDMFGGRISLVLASYNAGEGAVLKYGGNVPPYRETREYVKRIAKRYGI